MVRYLHIAEHGLIRDLQTATLVDTDGPADFDEARVAFGSFRPAGALAPQQRGDTR
jgi:hypothetical protein